MAAGRAERRIELGRDAGRCSAPIQQNPVDVGPGDECPGRVAELGPSPRPDTPPADDPGRPDQLVAGQDSGFNPHLRRANEPGQPSLGVPGAVEPALRRVVPRQVLGVPQHDRRSQQAVRTGLVEPDPIRRRTRLALGPVTPRDAAPSVVERLERDDAGLLMRRRLPLEPDLARPPRIEDDERHGQTFLLLGCVFPRVVELMKDVGVDPAGSPFAVVRLGGRLPLDRHVVRVDLGPNAVEQDPSLTPHRSAGTRRASSCAVSSSTIAPRNWLRTCSPRPATASETSRIASDRARVLGEHGPKSVGNIVRHASRIGRFAVHDRPGKHPLGQGGIGQEVRGARNERIRLDPGIDHGPRVASGVLEPHGRSRRPRRARPAGTSRASRSPGAGR